MRFCWTRGIFAVKIKPFVYFYVYWLRGLYA